MVVPSHRPKAIFTNLGHYWMRINDDPFENMMNVMIHYFQWCFQIWWSICLGTNGFINAIHHGEIKVPLLDSSGLQAAPGASECPGFAVSFLEGLGIATGGMGGFSGISWDFSLDLMGFNGIYCMIEGWLMDDWWGMGQWLLGHALMCFVLPEKQGNCLSRLLKDLRTPKKHKQEKVESWNSHVLQHVLCTLDTDWLVVSDLYRFNINQPLLPEMTNPPKWLWYPMLKLV